ncbi:MAG: hypothetical protein A3G33_06865 [Omnitrophica bacterium RIFCSPLOWO2_12_FULL_44_17]|uniref:Methyltransferase type 11 domain-containing protein n=1 Tax=Candidatus Danuiimicrobium aquiferis TaxID=1801832 RepID=A0A1G1KYN0_9BACT|nr:MAG: hypothetical protein A3B72_07160 [Omnitrophica bacterium RIFCSPHIGHO2_02_FULL_45_28]OGW88389.1 MAG: hypothetical protein A3E74_05815 [Omnitrophica bacterium RIFCSPHIGHO2_12_FULL_44_12]OGW97952.1 MAG: hypothetical protein A3G33_06865 [Omnitrophica bacterium RIFCSPLOWO2_12_FULL_44_17]OGX04217.1 MAG: hypothetical protein A3J12_11560 [Omnitrophica bacterium RIFCSPLOWO2_02_FULL_44_11]
MAFKKPSSVEDLRHFYDQEYSVQVIKDDDRAYSWMSAQLLKKYAAGKWLLDVGCGGGFLLKELQKFTPYTFGLDISQTALRISQKTSPSSKLVQGSAENLPFHKNTFDSLICLGSLEHFYDISIALGEFHRVVKPDGRIIIMVPNSFWYKDILSVWQTGDIGERNQTYEFFATCTQWKTIITQNQFKICQVLKYNGISSNPAKQWLKDLLIPLNLSYHFIFLCQPIK